MPHENSVFHSLLKHLPWDEFERLVEAHGADKRQRGFTAKTHLVAMICTQLCGTTSLRDIGVFGIEARHVVAEVTGAKRIINLE